MCGLSHAAAFYLNHAQFTLCLMYKIVVVLVLKWYACDLTVRGSCCSHARRGG